MRKMYIDFETRSTIDLRRCGVYVYAQHPQTKILMMAWAVDGGPVSVWRPGSPFPDCSGAVIVAHNAQFERVMWAHNLDAPVPPIELWNDTAARAAMCGLPRSLDEAAKALGIRHQKDDAGYRLMLQMCKPHRLTMKERVERGVSEEEMIAAFKSMPTNKEITDPRCFKWREGEAEMHRLAQYCMQDVEVERELDRVLPELPPMERRIWALDQKINDYGVAVDVESAKNIIAVIEKHTETLTAELNTLTGGAVSSAKQSTQLASHLGLANVQKATIKEALAVEEDDAKRRIMEIRQSLGMSSTAKYETLLDATCMDGRMRGLFMYHGAGTGRWTGKLFQPQNLPRGDAERYPDPDAIIEAMALRDPELIDLVYGDPMEAASNCLRGMLVAPNGKMLVAADFASIEGRGLAWVAGEEHVLQGYRGGLDPYKVDASAIYKTSYEDITKKQRQVGKTANLACGYAGGVAAMKRFGADKMGLSDGELQDIVTKWRAGRPATVALWRGLDEAAMLAVTSGQRTAFRLIQFGVKNGYLCMRLPNGRLLYYKDPLIQTVLTPWGGEREAITVMNVNGLTKKWERRPMHGGIWTENCIQALCRDLLAEAMLRLDERGYEIVLHVHDEIVAERVNPCPVELEVFMSEVPLWASGFPIRAEGFKAKRYRK